MNNKEIDKIKEIMNFFDTARWSKRNYPGEDLNYCDKYIEEKNGINNLDKKVLLHWITYISERGSDYQRIWDKGAYTYSYLLNGLTKNKIYNRFKPAEKNNNAYFITFMKNKKECYMWTAPIPSGEKYERIKKYLTEDEDERLYYISRYYQADYKCMYMTLHALYTNYNGSILAYIRKSIEAANKISIYERDKEEIIIKGLVFALYCLTYDEFEFINEKIKTNGIKRFKLSDVKDESNYKDFYKKIENHSKNITKIINNFEKYFICFDKAPNRYFKMKRVWCALRDYLKANIFNEFFEEVFKDIKVSKDKLLYYLELPGDVWNNNPTFRKCVFSEETNNIALNQYLREIFYKKNGKFDYYPEQFDCTFDFVPRMCESPENNCCFCPFNKQKENDFDKYCVNENGKMCTIAKICCGYDFECIGDDCQLRKILGLKDKI